MSGAFLISALSYAALFVMLKSQLHGSLGRMGLGILLICVIGATGVGIFTTDPMPLHFPLSTRGTLHVIFGTASIGTPSIRSAAYQPQPGSQQRSMEVGAASSTLDRWLTAVWLFKLCGLLGYFCVSLRTGAYGPGVNIGWPPRFAFLTYMLWVVILGWQATRCSRRASTEIQAKG